MGAVSSRTQLPYREEAQTHPCGEPPAGAAPAISMMSLWMNQAPAKVTGFTEQRLAMLPKLSCFLTLRIHTLETFLVPTNYLTAQLKGGRMYPGLVFLKAQLITVGVGVGVTPGLLAGV